MRITSITPMKNEAPFLLEWVAYHLLVGVNDILVFSNDCTDGTDLMLERLDELGFLRHYPNPSMYLQHPKHHLQVIRYINTSHRLGRSDWVVSLDVDEFIRVNVPGGTLPDLFNAVPDANMICLNQLNFGHGGVRTFEDKLLMDQFQYCWDYDGPYHRRIDRRGVKTLTHQSSKPREWHNHSPVFAAEDVDGVHCVNGSGIRLEEEDFTKDIKSLIAPKYGFDLVQLNHYALRAIDTFLLKVHRGNANHDAVGDHMNYWRRYDHNDRLDTRITAMSGAVRDAVDEMLKDTELRQLHERAVGIARDRIAELKQDETMQDLLKRIDKYASARVLGERDEI